jgi:large subunit ribosomal protein L22
VSKKPKPRSLTDTEVRAKARLVRISPRKLNLVAGMIRGKKVSTALAELSFSRRRIAQAVKRTLESAVANAENNHSLNVDALVISQAYVGKNLVMRRFVPRARGRAGRIQKPFSEITIIVREAEETA